MAHIRMAAFSLAVLTQTHQTHKMQTLNDLYHYVGSDAQSSSSGDLMTIDSTVRGQQRILRRLLTNPGDYIFHPSYGAGLPQYVGQIADVAKISALIRSQILLEECVAKTPEPVITVTPINNGLAVSIRYTDAATEQTANLSFNVNK